MIDFLEGLEYWSIGLEESIDATVPKNVGVQNVWVQKHEKEGKEVYAVALETVLGVSNWNEGLEVVLEDIVYAPKYDAGEFTVIKYFDTQLEAQEYASTNYPMADLSELIKKHYE